MLYGLLIEIEIEKIFVKIKVIKMPFILGDQKKFDINIGLTKYGILFFIIIKCMTPYWEPFDVIVLFHNNHKS